MDNELRNIFNEMLKYEFSRQLDEVNGEFSGFRDLAIANLKKCGMYVEKADAEEEIEVDMLRALGLVK